jgi:hypothetical protein
LALKTLPCTISAERILNYGGKRKGSITDSVYDRYEYDAEKRAALELWADALDAINGQGPAEIDGYHARLACLKGGEKIRGGCSHAGNTMDGRSLACAARSGPDAAESWSSP